MQRNLLFVVGKGGVGKTAVAEATALTLARRGKRVLSVAFEDPTEPAGEIRRVESNLWHLNCDAGVAFEEYAELKIGAKGLARIFVGNRVVRYLAKAAPGIHELVLLGKVWHERLNYDHVVVDMPSTGYGLAMFQSTKNFASLFQGGPIHRDALAMLETFADRTKTGQLVVALPEEMPLQEALELGALIQELFPTNPPEYLVNRVFPSISDAAADGPDSWTSPVPASLADYARKRGVLEEHNLRLWRDRGIAFTRLPYVPPPATGDRAFVREALVERLAPGVA
ncbi:MAG TPA: ArsA family ATPase [Bdellovibrionota bacterium]|nr:ArsA family ATPase [Bdellovibrionota bacterium]